MICMEPNTNKSIKSASCGHVYHRKCIDKLFQMQNECVVVKCPLCRETFEVFVCVSNSKDKYEYTLELDNEMEYDINYHGRARYD